MPVKQFVLCDFFEKSLDFSIHFFSTWLQGESICLRHPLFSEAVVVLVHVVVAAASAAAPSPTVMLLVLLLLVLLLLLLHTHTPPSIT